MLKRMIRVLTVMAIMAAIAVANAAPAFALILDDGAEEYVVGNADNRGKGTQAVALPQSAAQGIGIAMNGTVAH
jgi:hypothetical protein